MPEILEKRPEYWSVYKAGRKGAYARLKIYGPLGTFESRRKGGLIAQQRRRECPEKYKALGCNLRKVVAHPSHSPELAEAFGILLGDGGINPAQVTITLNAIDDKKYALFVKDLFEDLFKIKVSFNKRRSRGDIITLTMSGVNMVEFLVEQGLKVGNKVRQQVAIPSWIMRNQLYTRACVRGLMDTDGSVFTERHCYKDKVYSYKVLTLTNYSRPLIKQCRKILQNLKIKSIINNEKRFSVRIKTRIKKYLDLIGTNNPKHYRKFLDSGGVA